jgi:protein-S-isoprenylcysteine O-methyltransferase Ste14
MLKDQYRPKNTLKPILPPTYLLVSLVFMIAIHFSFPGLRLLPVPWNLVGILPVGLGVAVATTAEAQFHKLNTTVHPFKPSTSLVVDGMFRYSRNPMYLGFVLILVGVDILLGSLMPFILLPIFTAIIQFKFIRIEEKMMAESFGKAWLEYTQQTRRWI